LPITPVTLAVGVLLCAGGVAFTLWARITLGKNWSGFVVIKQDHELVQGGPYKYTRHPLYTGLIAAVTGSVLALMPTADGVLIIILWIAGFYIKSRQEERLMAQEFGDQYAAYRTRVKAALIPFVL
jgi:protein-S-isoprenylcysteine O-methyltransferase Ste14